MDKLEKELKREFQLERMILFSDAVFAIAITLLVIEIKVPEINGAITDTSIGYGLFHLIPVFFGFLISFLVIGIYWTVHHRLFGLLIAFDGKLLWLNLLFLLSIVIMPFTSALYGEFYQPNLLLPFFVYTMNLFFTGICIVLLINHISNPAKELSKGFDDRNVIKTLYARALMMPAIFIFGIIVSLITQPWAGRFAPILMPVAMMWINRWSSKHQVVKGRISKGSDVHQKKK